MNKTRKKLKSKNKALFLDRDGVINEDYGFVSKKKDFHLIKNIKNLINAAQSKNYKIIIVTNQAGIGRGYFSVYDFQKLMRYMKNLFLKDDCHVDAIYYCPFHPSKGIGKFLKNSFDRKPNPGMFLKAKKKFDLDMSKSILIGDKMSDIEAGINSFVKTNIFFNKNKRKINNKKFKFIEINELTKALKYL